MKNVATTSALRAVYASKYVCGRGSRSALSDLRLTALSQIAKQDLGRREREGRRGKRTG